MMHGLTSTRRGPTGGSDTVTVGVTPSVAIAVTEAVAAVARCADLARHAGCRRARCYLDGAAGNLRRALVELTHRHPFLADVEPGTFRTQDLGCGSEVLSASGFSDTILRCPTDRGALTVRALRPARSVEDGVWLLATGELPDVHVRGRVDRSGCALRFVEDSEMDDLLTVRAGPDLARDLIESELDLSATPVLAMALELTLVTGSWVHLASGSRWFTDLPTARAVVRVLRGAPGLDPDAIGRLGVCLDRSALILIERLGWRHWPTPAMD